MDLKIFKGILPVCRRLFLSSDLVPLQFLMPRLDGSYTVTRSDGDGTAVGIPLSLQDRLTV